MGHISLVRMAEAAGLGRIGKNGLLFNVEYGPRLMLGAVLTEFSLQEMTWPEKDSVGCPSSCCVCQQVCPVNAIDAQGRVDRPACARHSMQSPIFSLALKSGEIAAEDFTAILNTTSVDTNSMYTCTKCVSECPKC